MEERDESESPDGSILQPQDLTVRELCNLPPSLTDSSDDSDVCLGMVLLVASWNNRVISLSQASTFLRHVTTSLIEKRGLKVGKVFFSVVQIDKEDDKAMTMKRYRSVLAKWMFTESDFRYPLHGFLLLQYCFRASP